MADAFLFEVDASKVIAKLHLAGVQPLEYADGEFLANTGIVDDSKNATPENPGSVAFDLKNSSKKYQVGYAVPIKYTKDYNLDEKMKTLLSTYEKAIGKKSKIDLKADSSESKEHQKAIDDFKASLPEKYKPANDVKTDNSNSKFMTKEGIESLQKLVDSIKKEYEKSYTAAVDAAKEKAYKQVSTYLNIFAGKDNVNPFNADSFGQVFVADGVKSGNDKRLVRDYEFQEAPDSEKQKMVSNFMKEFEKDPSKENCSHRMLFYVDYMLDADK